ncbi:hypothetical protein [uncultured Dokdonia sp.]|uniref:hypothetical protein n=1 Tax=uncultured Dokdonia sp. TaxID=575653 RepID=UPI00263682EB|nr:hypothetical protein [uncultured Dokdonia sp.]
MKNILTTLSVIILSIVCFSCATDDTESHSAAQDLGSDARFISFMQDQSTVLDNVKDFNAFQPFFDKTHISDADITIISSLLGYDSKAQYESHLNKQNETIKALNEQYDLSKYTQAQLTQFALDALNTTKRNSETPVDIDPIDELERCIVRCQRELFFCTTDSAIQFFNDTSLCDINHVNDPAALRICKLTAEIAHLERLIQCHTTAIECLEACGNN